MTITILTLKKLSNQNYISNLYMKKLHYNVKQASGFIKGSSYWTCSNYNIITISHWNTRQDWNNWLKNDLRNDIQKEYKDLIEEESHEELSEIVRTYNIFLL